MPPQQAQHLLDFGHRFFDFGSHLPITSFAPASM
jgi:hypothetical protein